MSIKLSKTALVGLGIYIGYKPHFRRTEMEAVNLNYDAVIAELTNVNLIKSGRMDLKAARVVFNELIAAYSEGYVPSPSQIQHYKGILLD